MSCMSEAELKAIDNFEVCQEGLGSIKWPGVTDVRGLDLDQLISINNGTVTLSHGDLESADLRLNKDAVISLKVKRSVHTPEESEKLQERIQYLTERAGHTFLSYD